MAPYHLVVDQGSTLRRSIAWGTPPIDVTGWSARLEIRSRPGQPVLDALTVGDGLALDGSAGTVDLEISAARSDAWSFDRANYDLVLWNADDVRLVQGDVVVSRRVTVRP